MPLPLHPDLAQLWHPTKNGLLTPADVSAKSSRKVWWLRKECGHEWESTPVGRNKNPSGCPVCSGHAIMVGVTDLPSTHPSLSVEWHPTLNSGLTAEQVSAGSNKKVWWQGSSCGHEWEAAVYSRTIRGDGCPYCAHKKVDDSNSLAHSRADIANEWHPSKNGELTASHVTAGSDRKVWWQCDNGHEWEAMVSNRTHKVKPTGCPYCMGSLAISGESDLATLDPELAAEWHPNLNGALKPSQVTAGSDRKVWWLGPACGHAWQASIANRHYQQTGCSFCSGRTVLPEQNSLAVKLPEIAVEWHPTKNGELTPDQVHPASNRKVWWQCENGHEWEAFIYARINGGCRRCTAGRKASKGESEIKDFLESLGVQVEHSDRTVLSPLEIDLYLPAHRVGVEYNGLYWHSEATRSSRNAHEEKWQASKTAGVTLLQIWEDDWRNRPEIVKRLLAHKLGLTRQRAVYARKTDVVELATAQAQAFLEENHIQGYASGSHYLALQEHTGETVALMVLKLEGNGVLNIIRYATSANVAGGFTKLLKAATRRYAPQQFITFSDHTISDGALYEKNGFLADKELAPDYMYVVNGQRKHKFGYRLKRFRDDPNLRWQPGLTESELARLNKMPRIWDAGKTRWIFTPSES